MPKLNEKYTQAIWEFTEALQQENQMENALANCLDIMKDTIGCEGGFVWLLDRDTDRLIIVTCAAGMDVTGVTIDRRQGIVGHVMDTAQTLVFHGRVPEDSPLRGSDEATGLNITSQLVTALKTPGGEPFGCIHLINRTNGRFGAEEIRLSENLAALAALDIDDKGYQVRRPSDRRPMISLKKVIKEFPSGDGVIRVLSAPVRCV